MGSVEWEVWSMSLAEQGEEMGLAEQEEEMSLVDYGD
jgi:hypothetical protein